MKIRIRNCKHDTIAVIGGRMASVLYPKLLEYTKPFKSKDPQFKGFEFVEDKAFTMTMANPGDDSKLEIYCFSGYYAIVEE